VTTEPFARIRHALSHLAPGEDRFVARAARLGYEACNELEAEVERLREDNERLRDKLAEAMRMERYKFDQAEGVSE
jgi:hypothetical protein